MPGTNSRLGAVAKKTPAFSPEDRIDHSVYGLGTIVEVNGRNTTIDFDEAGIKKFVTSMVELSSSSTPAPDKPGRRKKKKTTKGTPSAKVAKKKTSRSAS